MRTRHFQIQCLMNLVLIYMKMILIHYLKMKMSCNYICSLDYKDSIEIAEEEAINNVFDHNKYELIKKRLDYDIAVIGMGAVKNEYTTSEGINIKYVDPADLVYSYTESPHFDDIYYVGEIRKVSVVDLKNNILI